MADLNTFHAWVILEICPILSDLRLTFNSYFSAISASVPVPTTTDFTYPGSPGTQFSMVSRITTVDNSQRKTGH